MQGWPRETVEHAAAVAFAAAAWVLLAGVGAKAATTVLRNRPSRGAARHSRANAASASWIVPSLGNTSRTGTAQRTIRLQPCVCRAAGLYSTTPTISSRSSCKIGMAQRFLIQLRTGRTAW